MNIHSVSSPFFLRTTLIIFRNVTKLNTREESHNQIVFRYVVKHACPPPIRFFDFGKQINNMVGLTKVVLNVVVLGGDAKFYKFILKRAALLKKAMHFSFYFHYN